MGRETAGRLEVIVQKGYRAMKYIGRFLVLFSPATTPSLLNAGVNSHDCAIEAVQVYNEKVQVVCSGQVSGDCNVGVYQYANDTYSQAFKDRLLSVALAAQAQNKTVVLHGYVDPSGTDCRIDKIRVSSD